MLSPSDAQAPGTNPTSTERFAAQVVQLRKHVPGILVVAYPHWGSNYGWRTSDQRRAGRALIGALAELVRQSGVEPTEARLAIGTDSIGTYLEL